METLSKNKLSDNTYGSVLPFPNLGDEIASERQAISRAHRVVMAVLAQANAPDNVRNFIDALINLSGGRIRVEASDYKIALAFYKDEKMREKLKKRVQRWRKALDKWQDQSGYTMVQIQSGFKISETKNQPSIYTLIILELAAKVLSQGETDIEAAAKSVLSHAKGISSKIDDGIRRAKLTSDSCRIRAVTWFKKSLEMAKAEGCLDEVAEEFCESVGIILDEYKCAGEGGTEVSHLDTQSGTDLNSISTTISTSSINTDRKVALNAYDESVAWFESVAEKHLASDAISVKAKPTTMLEHALDHARRGFRVFPVHIKRTNGCSCRMNSDCPTPAKHPRVNAWNRVATTDEKTIRDWWRCWPQSNIGIATGRPTGQPSGIVVLDVDTKSDGFASLSKLESEYGALPETLTARTGSGGRHILFTRPDNVEIRNLQASQKLGCGLDVRGDGGFIVAAGSIHESGNRYEWVDEYKRIAAIPNWLLEKLIAPVSAQSDAHAVGASARSTQVQTQGTGLCSVVGEGGRNNFLFAKAAGLVRSHNYSESLERVQWWNDRCCVPPVDAYELEKLVKHAHVRYGTH